MADITTRTFGQLVQGQAAAIQARAAGLVDVTIGSICRAVIEATASVALWLQANIMALLATTRLSTSTGDDVDTWIADWGAAPQPGDPTLFARLPAQAATGQVTFSRFASTGSALVPVGATVSSADGTRVYTVTLDPTVPGFAVSLSGYLMNPNQNAITVPVACTTAGAGGNAAIGGINTITTAIPGVDLVTNAAAFINGADAETDDAVKLRFRNYVQALRRGTPEALAFAVTQLRRGVTAIVVENQEQSGAVRKGFVYLVVDDGTGRPSVDLLASARAAVMDAHAAGVEFAVYPPQVIPCDVRLTVTAAAGADRALVQATVKDAVTNYLNGLAGGSPVLFSRLYQVAYDCSPDVQEVTALSLNNLTIDIPITINQVAKAGSITVLTA